MGSIADRTGGGNPLTAALVKGVCSAVGINEVAAQQVGSSKSEVSVLNFLRETSYL